MAATSSEGKGDDERLDMGGEAAAFRRVSLALAMLSLQPPSFPYTSHAALSLGTIPLLILLLLVLLISFPAAASPRLRNFDLPYDPKRGRPRWRQRRAPRRADAQAQTSPA